MRLFHFIFFFIMVLSSLLFAQEVRAKVPVNMKVDRLAAWCIVPFDAKRRGPEARAKMLARLGIKRCAYDWRGEHVKDFEEEILQYKKHGIEFFAFWAQQHRIGQILRWRSQSNLFFPFSVDES